MHVSKKKLQSHLLVNCQRVYILDLGLTLTEKAHGESQEEGQEKGR